MMAGAKLAAVHHHHELAPVVDEMLRPLRADAVHDDCFSGPSMAASSLLGEPQIPPVAVADLDVDEPGGAQRGGALLEGDHVVGDALEPEEFHHFRRVAPRSAAQPVARDEASARAQHAQHLGEDLRLVGNLHHRILGEHDIEARLVERQRARRRPARRESGPTSPARSMRRCMTASSAGSMSTPTTDRAPNRATNSSSSGTQSAADVEHRAAADIAALEAAASSSSSPPGDRKPSPQMICKSASMPASYSPGSLN